MKVHSSSGSRNLWYSLEKLELFHPGSVLLSFDCQSAVPSQFSSDVAACLFFWFPLQQFSEPFPEPDPRVVRNTPTRNPCSTITADFSPKFTPKTKSNNSILCMLLSFHHSFICKLIKYQVLGHIYVSTSRLTHFTSSGNVGCFCHLSSKTSSTSQNPHHTVSIWASSPSAPRFASLCDVRFPMARCLFFFSHVLPHPVDHKLKTTSPSIFVVASNMFAITASSSTAPLCGQIIDFQYAYEHHLQCATTPCVVSTSMQV